MSIEEQNGYYEQKRKKENEEKEKLDKAEKMRKMEQLEKSLQISSLRLDLDKLKSLIENGLVDVDMVENFAEGEDLDKKEIKVLFDKIDEIENLEDIDSLLPGPYRVSKEEYLLALSDSTQRAVVLKKLDDALGYLISSSMSNKRGISAIFLGFVYLLNKNLRLVQENTIDLKRYLQSKNT